MEKESLEAPNSAAFKADDVESKPPKPSMISPHFPRNRVAIMASGALLSPAII